MSDDEMEVLDGLLVAVVRRIALMERVTVGESVLTLPESFVLRELERTGELSQQELADRLWMDKSRVSRVASGLEGSGWVERSRASTDRRQYRVRLTKTGARLARSMVRTMRRHHGEIFEAMTQKERSGLRLGLRGLHRAFEEASMHAHGDEATR